MQQGGFSIREYASRMRSINVVNCWPFDETSSEETVKSLLPPITVKKFTWWPDELEFLHSESAKTSEKKKKKKQQLEKGETSLKAEDQDMDESDIGVEEGMEVVKVKSLKGKMKAPKKRSIVEIFAVAPPVERVFSDEEEEDSVEEGNKNKTKTKKTNTDVILKKALRVVKKIKKMAQKQEHEMGQSVPNKENCFKLKLRVQEKATGNQSTSYGKELENDIHDHISTLKRKPRLQHLNACKKMPRKALKLIEGNQHPGLPVRGILKYHGKAFCLKQSKKCILQEAVKVNQSSAEKVDKHVSFSEKDEMLRLSRKPSHSIEYFKLKKVCSSDTGNVNHDGGLGKDSITSETSGSENASIKIGKEVGAGPASNEQLTTCLFEPTTTKQHNEEHSGRTEAPGSTLHDMNRHRSDSHLRDEPHNSVDACPRFFRMPLDGYYNCPNIKEIRNSCNSTSGRLNKDLRTPGPVFPPLHFEDCLRTYNEVSVSHLSNMEERTYKLPQASLESIATNNANTFQFQAFPCLSPRELLHTFCSLPDGSQTRIYCGKRNINEDFVGLPLNSQGELIALNSCAKNVVNQITSSSVNAAHSISLSPPSNAVPEFFGHHSEFRSFDCGTSTMDQLNLFPIESCVKENPIAVIPTRLGVTESQSESKTNLDSNFLAVNCHPFLDSEYTMCKKDNQVQTCPGNEKIQSTMRLMGKEFKVGGRDVEGFEDGCIWKDKQIIDELHFGNNSVNSVMHDQNKQSLGKLRETFFCPSELTINHRSESNYSLPHFDSQTSSTYQSVLVARNTDPVQKLYPSLCAGTFSEVYNSESLFSEPFTRGYESRLFTLELPTPAVAHQELCPYMSPSAIQLKNEQNLHHASTSAIKFPFMNPDLNEHAKSSWTQRSYVERPPLCFDVSKKATQLSNSQSCNLVCNHPYLIAGPSHGTDSSVCCKPGDFCVSSSLSSGSASQTSVAPASLAPMPYYSGIVPVSAMQKRHGNQKKIQERITSRIGIKGLDNGKKSKGQLSAVSTVPFKPLKMPTLGFHEGFHCAVKKPTAHVSFEDSVENMEDAFESCSITDKSKLVVCGEYEANKNEERISPWMGPCINTARAGPVKLTAGTKHILKACQQKDQSSSRSTDQDISVPTTTIGFRFSESENSTIYRFSGKAPMFKP